jgi:hypothetical protein
MDQFHSRPIFLNFLIVNVSDYQQILPLGERLQKEEEGSTIQALFLVNSFGEEKRQCES